MLVELCIIGSYISQPPQEGSKAMRQICPGGEKTDVHARLSNSPKTPQQWTHDSLSKTDSILPAFPSAHFSGHWGWGSCSVHHNLFLVREIKAPQSPAGLERLFPLPSASPNLTSKSPHLKR